VRFRRHLEATHAAASVFARGSCRTWLPPIAPSNEAIVEGFMPAEVRTEAVVGAGSERLTDV